MKLKQTLIALALLAATSQAFAADKLRLVLDWYINPDHAPILVAEQIGAFKKAGLDVDIVAPSSPDLPPRMVAAHRADLAITYQPHVHFFADKDLPLVRVGTLVDSPLNTVLAIDKDIKSPADLKGKKVGYSISGIEQADLATMAEHEKIDLDSVDMINVNFQLVSALLSHRVDAVIGGYRNVEALEIKQHGVEPVVMNIEDYGVPSYDELVLVANRDSASDPKIQRFLKALKEGVTYLQAHPEKTWQAFAKAHPDLDNKLNHASWLETAPLFAKDPARLDRERYDAFEHFLFDHKLIKKVKPVDDYAVQLD